MKALRIALAALLIGLSPAVGQQFPNVPDHTVVGRIGTGSGSGPSQAIPFSTFGSQLLQSSSTYDIRAYFPTVCTGSDDTAAIQGAVNTMNTAGGGRIVFPAATCNISSPGIDFTNKGNVALQGQGNGRNLSTAVTRFIYTSATGSMFKLDGSVAIKFMGIGYQYSNASYNGDLFDLRQISGVLNTNQISISDCFMFGLNSSTANSFIRMGLTLSTRIERCLFQGAATAILGGANANGVYIANNFFNQGSSAAHISVQGEGWTLLNNTFEPSSGTTGCKNVNAVGVTNGLFMAANTFNDCQIGTTDTLINLSGFAVNAQSFTGNIVQGGNIQYNAGSGVGVSITGNTFISNAIDDVVVNSATSVLVTGNQNVGGGTLINAYPSGNYVIDPLDGGGVRISSAVLATALSAANGGTGITSLGSGIPTFLGTPSSANLATALTDETGSGALVFANTPTLVTPNIGAATGTSLAATSSIKSSSASAGIGYATGAGGTVTQGTNRNTGVTLNTISGAITLFTSAPTVGVWNFFTVTNSSVAATDTVIVSVKSSGGNGYNAIVTAVAAGSFQIGIASMSGTNSDAPVVNFNVIKGVAN